MAEPSDSECDENGMREVPVALKILRKRGATPSDADLLKLDREILTLRSLSVCEHPSIVRFYHKFQDQGGAVIVMEFIEGQTLAQLLSDHLEREHNVSHRWCENVLFWGIKLSWALDYLGKLGIFHGDIKPANIVLRSGDAAGNDEPVLTDFSIGAGLHSGPPDYLPLFQGLDNSLPWLSPEQMLSDRSVGPPLSSKSDVYGLGATLWHLLTESPPIPINCLNPLAEKRKFQVWPTILPDTLTQQPKEDLARLLSEMLDFEPANRPPPSQVARRLGDIFECAFSRAPITFVTMPPIFSFASTEVQLPRFERMANGAEIASELVSETVRSYWSKGVGGEIGLGTDGQTSARMSYGEALTLIEDIQGQQKEGDDWVYRLPRYEEWIAAAGISATGVSRGRRIFTDLPLSGMLPEWTQDQSLAQYPECRRVVFIHDGLPESLDRHTEWPKGAVRLVRTRKPNDGPSISFVKAKNNS